MDIITKQKFNELANIHEPHSISIYLPTHRTGQAVINEEDKIRFKNLVKKVKADLKNYPLQEDEIDKIMAPTDKLMNDNEFWRHLSDGLAVFISNNRFEYFTVPVKFDEQHYISTELYLKPLIPLSNGNGSFYLLALSLKNVNFYECTRYSIAEIKVDDLVPEKLQEAIGYDYEERSLQMRSQQSETGEGMYHGHNIQKDDKKTEIKKFFRYVNNGIMKLIHDEDLPLIVACVDYLFPIYKKANNYNFLYDKCVKGNPDQIPMAELHEIAWDIISEKFDKNRIEKLEKYEQALSKGKASFKIDEIIPAAVWGKIDTLFVNNNKNAFGQFDKENNLVVIESKKTASNVSLLNLAVIKTFLQNGNVYLMNDNEMPVNDRTAAAIFRY